MESYKHIELTREEITEALITAFQKKEAIIKQKELSERVHQNRLMKMVQLDAVMIDGYMRKRAESIFTEPFDFGGQCNQVYKLLCLYFSNDPEFLSYAAKNNLIANDPDLDKGVLLAGSFGVGKSWIMKLFQKQTKQVYYMRSAKEITADYMAIGEMPGEYVNLYKNPVNDNSVFQQEFTGLCIDDMGAEEAKNRFGNKVNVIGDIIEARYDMGNTGRFLHATTNLDAKGLTDFYGGRVTSRMKQIFNIIQFKGNDLRK